MASTFAQITGHTLETGAAEPLGIGWILMVVAFMVMMAASAWRVYVRAGEPGWAALVPFYNMWVLVRIARMEPWWFVLLLIPMVNLVAWIIVWIKVAERFGHGAGFGLGLMFLTFIFLPILAFEDY